MNDFEDKLRSLPFRELPAGLRRNVLAAATSAAQEAAQAELPAWTWRNWLWPSPLAWAALAVLLAGSFSVDALMDDSPPGTTVSPSAPAPDAGPPAFQPRGREVAFLQTLP